MVEPATGIVRIELHGHAAAWRDKDGVSHRPGDAGPIDPGDLEMMAMQVHWMGHHRVVHKLKRDTLARLHLKLLPLLPGLLIQGPGIRRHRSAEHDHQIVVDRPRTQGSGCDQLLLERQVDRYLGQFGSSGVLLNSSARSRENDARSGDVTLAAGE